MTATNQSPSTIRAEQALATAQAAAIAAYRDLTPYRIRLSLESDGWHVDYDLKETKHKGGGPHFVIDAVSGAIVHKRFEQ